MKTKDFLKKHDACPAGASWALSISDDMADVWDALIKEEKHGWLLWAATRSGVFPYSALRKLACRFVRKTPLADGRKVWDLLTDERSRKAVEVAESYADGKATAQELDSARDAARDAARAAADAAARAAADAAAFAAYDAPAAAAYAAACAAVDAAFDAADAAARAAARDAAADAYATARASADAARATARAAAEEAQIRMIAELGNPFK